MKSSEKLFGGGLPPPVLRTAHDVRHLAPCEGCGVAGDDRHMIRAGKGKLWHGRCVIRRDGFARLLKFRKTELERLTMGDLGPYYMKRLLDVWGNL